MPSTIRYRHVAPAKAKKFVDAYFANGRSLVDAYVQVFPKSSHSNAVKNASHLMQHNDMVKELVKAKEKEIAVKHDFTIDKLMQEAINNYMNAETNKYKLEWFREIAKIVGAYASKKIDLKTDGTPMPIQINIIEGIIQEEKEEDDNSNTIDITGDQH